MKAISPMIATVLLIAFTVAVGGILAVWFSSYTKTQTSSVSKNSACSTTHLDVSAPVINPNEVQILITNYGPETVNITSVSVSCGSSYKIKTIGKLLSEGENTLETVSITGCDSNNIKITVVASCLVNGSPQGMTQASCQAESCS